jgi:hypothetical protein
MSESPPDVMRLIWTQVSQPGPGGKRFITYRNRNDLEYLYKTGFVDTDKYTLAQWVDAFKDSLQPNGCYMLSEIQWMAKKPYRYEGLVYEPVDPLALKEGEWDKTEFEKLIMERVFPSLTIDKKIFDQALEQAKKNVTPGGKIILTKEFKTALKRLLDTFPSPKRVREMSVQDARVRSGQAAGAPQAAQPRPQAPAVKTAYSKGQAASKTAVDQLSKLLWKK